MAGRDALSGALGRSGLFEAPSAPAQDKSVVFIESDVADVPALLKDIAPSAQVVMLDATKDGVDAIADYLSTHAGVQNVAIFSHGGEGTLNLGTASLDASSMQGRYAADLATIKASLAPDANILVYGCDFAANADGDAAAHLLASLTGANVAASTNLTGGTAEGGDFVLEDRIGTVSAPDILAPTIATDYDGVLASPTTVFATSGTGLYHANLEFLTYANTTLATGGITNGATATYTTSNGSTVTATFSAVSNANNEATFKPAAFSAYAPSKFYSGYNNTSSTSEQLYGGYSGTSSFTVTFTATDKNGKSYAPNIAFADSEVTDGSGEYYKVTSNGGAFSNVETVGSTGYSLTGTGTQTFTLSGTGSGVPVLVTTGATSLNVTVEIAGGKEGFALALVEPTLTLDANDSSGSTGANYVTTFTEKGAGGRHRRHRHDRGGARRHERGRRADRPDQRPGRRPPVGGHAAERHYRLRGYQRRRPGHGHPDRRRVSGELPVGHPNHSVLEHVGQSLDGRPHHRRDLQRRQPELERRRHDGPRRRGQ